ncbi:MAG: hypothetical protein PHH71_00220 [Clostridia bacterium]|jgi:outer membrane biosynthesis protein TonB|nr:hypothetical protein [Clostridia bacterium]MDD3231919.1 hypothetical protein [Clostridia bacterium]MDD3862485.1 hypothetical protein [Clostridia bacterium]MDD4408695.1 hypothetical protein [Clostridia bacterium]
MLLREFEDILRNIEADRSLMSYGTNKETVNSILSIVNLLQSALNVVSLDRSNDMFTNIIANKLLELEEIVVSQGSQRLFEHGINLQQYAQYVPKMPTASTFNNPYFYNRMYSSMQMPPSMPTPQFIPAPQFAPQPQYAPAPQPQFIPTDPITPPPAPQAPQEQPPQPQVPQQPQQPQPAPTAPQPAPDIKNSTSQTSPKPSFDDVLPGASSGSEGDKAAGRDYLLQLLQEKE